jgi:gluconate 2-dehydrogenase gamma chain
MAVLSQFFNRNYQTPEWFTQKKSRRALLKGALKSAAGVGIATCIPASVLAGDAASEATRNEVDKQRQATLNTERWQTLAAVLAHMLPASAHSKTDKKSSTEPDISAEKINAVTYLYNVVHLQPTPQAEVDFIYKGVGWLNGYSQTEYSATFIALNNEKKELLLRNISKSTAGNNWLSTLLDYLLEAILSPPIYGGNTNKAGWEYLEHQGGFPLPDVGTRYYEVPSPQGDLKNNIKTIAIKNSDNASKVRKA